MLLQLYKENPFYNLAPNLLLFLIYTIVVNKSNSEF
jgi:hypothetical protein